MSKHSETQHIRLSAIDAELVALSAQAKALGLISIEHHCGVDVGCNVSIDYFVGCATDLVKSLKATLERIKSMSDVDCAATVKAFEGAVAALQDEIRNLISQREDEADRHLEQGLNEPRPKPVPDAAIPPDFAGDYKADAHKHCHAAEISEVKGFVTQLVALTELCLETLCIAAESAAE